MRYVNFMRRSAIIALLVIFCIMAFGCSQNKLKSDSNLGVLVTDKIENAQYMPDVDKLATLKKSAATSSLANAPANNIVSNGYKEVNVSVIDKNSFIGVLNTLGEIGDEGAGKYLGYDIFEIKKEIAFVVENAPYFNQWFRLPTMRDEQGYVSIPYYEGWAYYIQSDNEAKNITITRVCWHTVFNYFDFDKKRTVDDFTQHEVMQIKYYYDELDREVVECSVYCVADVGKKSIPINLEYLKNVKDTSLTRCNIRIEERYRADEVGSDGGRDIRGKYPYGTARDFVELNYKDENNIQLLKISQILPTDIYNWQPTTDITFYNLTESGVQFLAHTYDYAIANVSRILSLHTYESQFDEFDVANYFCTNGYLNHYSRTAFPSDYSDFPSRTHTSAQVAGDENAMLRSLQNTIEKLANNLGLKDSDISAFQDVFELRNTINSPVLSAEKAVDDLIAAVSKEIIDNLYLKNEWKKIYSDSEKAVTLPEMKGPFASVNMPLESFHNLMDFYYDNSGEVNPSCYARLIDEEYSDCNMRLALRSDDGEYIFIFLESRTTFENGCIVYRVKDGMLTVELENEGTYTAVYVLTRVIDGIETVVFDTLQTPYVHRFVGVDLPETVNKKGETIEYEVHGRGRKLIVIATVVDK